MTQGKSKPCILQNKLDDPVDKAVYSVLRESKEGDWVFHMSAQNVSLLEVQDMLLPQEYILQQWQEHLALFYLCCRTV